MTQPSIPGLESVVFLAADGPVRSYRAVDADGNQVRAFIASDAVARSRLERWAEIEPNSRWVDIDEDGALICRWEATTGDAARDRLRQNPRAALEACLPCLDELAHSHQLGMPHCGVDVENLHYVDGRFILPPPRAETTDAGLAADLADAKRLVSRLLTPDADATLVSNAPDTAFLTEALRVLEEDQESVVQLRDSLRGLFGSEVEQPTIVSGQTPMAESQVALPEQVAGFEVRRLLGKGGMGYVFEAFDSHLEREIALKTVRLDILGEAGKERFLREARACSRITHPNIVTVYSAGESDGDPYMAMELVRGQTLGDRLKEGAVDWEQLVRWIVQLLDALERLHSEGIVHRDLKPENIMLTEEGVPKLMDFGLAHMAAAAQLTATGMMVGTVHYMSPEQVLGGEIDARSDVFSMGVLLYRALSGSFPFEGDHPMSVMYAIQNAPAPKLDTATLDVPFELSRIIDRALQKEREQRFASAGPFRDALRELIDSDGEARPAASSRSSWILGAAVVVVAALAVWQLSTRSPAEADRGAAVQHNELGRDLESEGRIAEARAEYRRALVADDSYPVAWNNLGMLAYADNELAEADSFLRRAAELDPDYATPRFNRGGVLEDRGFPERAIRSYASSIAVDSTFAAGYNNLAALLSDRGRAPEAEQLLERAFSNVSAGDVFLPYLHRTSGRVYRELGQFDRAVEEWRIALESLPDDPLLHDSLAQTLERLGDASSARPHWERLLTLGDDDQRRRAAESLEGSD